MCNYNYDTDCACDCDYRCDGSCGYKPAPDPYDQRFDYGEDQTDLATLTRLKSVTREDVDRETVIYVVLPWHGRVGVLWRDADKREIADLTVEDDGSIGHVYRHVPMYGLRTMGYGPDRTVGEVVAPWEYIAAIWERAGVPMEAAPDGLKFADLI